MYFLLHLSEPFSRRIGWNQFPVLVGTNFPPSAVLGGTFLCIIFPAVLFGINFLPYWLEPIPCCSSFPAVLVGTNFLPYWLEPMSRRFGWNCFPQNIFLCICWNQFPAVLVGTNSLSFCFSRCICWNQFPAVFVGTIFPLYFLEPILCHRICCNHDFDKTIHACCPQPVSGWYRIYCYF